MKYIHFNDRELLKLIAIIRGLKADAAGQRNKAETALMNELINKLLRYEMADDGSIVLLDAVTRYSLWLCVEKYINFCAEARNHHEYCVAVGISEKLSN